MEKRHVVYCSFSEKRHVVYKVQIFKKKKKVFFLPFSGILCLFILGWIGLNQYVAKVTSTRSIFIYFKMNKLAMSMRN